MLTQPDYVAELHSVNAFIKYTEDWYIRWIAISKYTWIPKYHVTKYVDE